MLEEEGRRSQKGGAVENLREWCQKNSIKYITSMKAQGVYILSALGEMDTG